MLFVSMRVKPAARAASFDDQLAHVRNIENPDIVSHGMMFLDDARVLDGHEPSGERHNFRAKPHVFIVKWRSFLCGFAHAGKLDFVIRVSKVDRPLRGRC